MQKHIVPFHSSLLDNGLLNSNSFVVYQNMKLCKKYLETLNNQISDLFSFFLVSSKCVLWVMRYFSNRRTELTLNS